ncbi:pepsin/retropepsin-like aspartic protease family protein [Hymenobacter ginkgonis]|uniref:pepsin/retropepsin-like aspartic protease family protein n=1 Tax=Hymenobacter ginkgonis TaxID=2682976 RepID=UPI0018DBAB0E|nr:pepsin/retropepsin-like aspartic protease family protein [Hymenobacter ginkgonis]
MRIPSFISLLGSLVLTASFPSRAQRVASAAPQPQRVDTTASFTLPFDLVGGLIVLRNLTLNGQQGDFLLDTGNTTALAVESTAFMDQLQPSSSHAVGHGATGTVAVQELPVTNFQVGAAHYSGFIAQAFSLAAIRRYVGPRLLGLIGYGLLREYEIVIDYPHRRVSWYSLNVAQPTRRPFVRQDSLAFTLVRGAPVATGSIGQVPVQLMLDTGAAASNLDTAFCQTLAPADQPTSGRREPIAGSDNHQQLAHQGTLPTLLLGSTTWQNLPVVVFPLSQPVSGRALGYQGILGYPFFIQHKVISFHYGRQQFYSLTPSVPAKAAP